MFWRCVISVKTGVLGLLRVGFELAMKGGRATVEKPQDKGKGT